jgi:hypothetical protein
MGSDAAIRADGEPASCTTTPMVVYGFLLGECLRYVHQLDLAYEDAAVPVTSNPFNHDILLNLVTFLEAGPTT